MFLFNLQKVLCTIVQKPTPEVEKPKILTQFDIFDQVFVNSSLPDISILQEANTLLNSTIDAYTIPPTPVCWYIWKLTAGTEQLHIQNIVHKHNTNNLRLIIKKYTTCTKGKRVILKSYFYISTQELYNTVVEAEKDTKEKAKKKKKKKTKTILYKSESRKEVEEEDQEES